ncbi:DUF447 domain-containing protein [Thiocapsa rosea]|uniref:Tetrahydromethanopterin synthesis protein n=1 Tax=Thiocapsa rosea TaxID=69360 RepID=A0A495VCJ9_9GAMM|nr:DUF447 domain-containing protein [Thiocapsa rosea]RKT47126.1 hypothetical protein BDD21_4681 [Thiocapsa rosea]
MIHEVIVTTLDPGGRAHIAPMGIRHREGRILVAPFRPSSTLDNVLRTRCAVINYTDDVRIFAGCLTGRTDWPLTRSERVEVPRLADGLAHVEVELAEVEDDPLRPRLFCRPLHEANHLPFRGFNRARAAILELAILVSRLDLLPAEKIAREIDYLQIAVEKTAGPREQEAWAWLMERVEAHRAGESSGP